MVRLRLWAPPVVLITVLALLSTASPVSATTQHRVRTRAAHSAVADAFVTRSGSQLALAGRPWRFSGVNMYWLGLDENVTDAGGPTYPTRAAVDSGFRAAVALGATVVRSTTLGVSVGSPRSLEPSLGVFNKQAFASIDYAVAEARRYGERLIIPLTDEWHFYEGGKHNFTNWAGYPDVPGQNLVTNSVQRQRESAFYTDPAVIADFHAYVAQLLGHVNPITHLRLGSDPTIAMWETGNELWDAPPAWTEQTASYLKSLAPNTLVADGSAASGKAIAETGYAGPHVDVIDAHFYPTDATKAVSDAQFVAAHGKAYVIGEYPLSGTDTASWLSALAADHDVSGDLAWSLLPWANGVPEPHDDGYTFHHPGATSAEQAEDALLQAHARAENPS